MDFLFEVAVTTTAVLTWRTLSFDHEWLYEYAKKIPVIGSAFACGFCTAVWASLVAILIYDPLASLHPTLPVLARIWADWFAFSATVLFLRNVLAALMEGTGVLTHLHRSSHK